MGDSLTKFLNLFTLFPALQSLFKQCQLFVFLKQFNILEMKINTYLKDKSAESTPLVFSIHYVGYRLRFYLNQSVNPKDWSIAKQKHKKDNVLNDRIDNWKKIVESEFNDHIKREGFAPLPTTLQKLLKAKLRLVEKEPIAPESFLDFFSKFIERSVNGSRQPKDKPIEQSTIQVYKRTLQSLLEFRDKTGRKIDFLTLSYDFYDQYVKYLMGKNYRNNTIGKHLRYIKVVANEALAAGHDIHPFIKSKNFKVLKQTDIDAIYLDPEQIKELESIDYSLNPRLDKVRDTFLIQCYTGLRYSDVENLNRSNIKGNLICVTTQKTNTRLEIPIDDRIGTIIKKYNGAFPRSPKNQKMNDYLKEIGQNINSLHEKFQTTTIIGGKKIIENKPKWQLLTTHTARRSFCTNAYIAGVPIQDIMLISGHKTEKSFRLYLKMTDGEHSRAANVRILNTKNQAQKIKAV